MILVDTDVVSLLFKRHSLARAFAEPLKRHQLYISFATAAEIEFGMQRSAWGQQRRQDMAAHLSDYAVIESNPVICRQWALVMNESFLRGRVMSHPDAWIAATALVIDVPLATNNLRHFRHLDRLKFLLP